MMSYDIALVGDLWRHLPSRGASRQALGLLTAVLRFLNMRPGQYDSDLAPEACRVDPRLCRTGLLGGAQGLRGPVVGSSGVHMTCLEDPYDGRVFQEATKLFWEKAERSAGLEISFERGEALQHRRRVVCQARSTRPSETLSTRICPNSNASFQ